MRAQIKNVVLPARRYDETLAFYRDVIGLDVFSEGRRFCFLRAGGVHMAIHAVDDESAVSPTGRGIYLDLLVDDLAAARNGFSEAGVLIQREWTDHNGDFVLVADPEGNLLEVFQATVASRDERSS
jgi:catechol-2,3-dioxygenase